jgi:hypothetical protein
VHAHVCCEESFGRLDAAVCTRRHVNVCHDPLLDGYLVQSHFTSTTKAAKRQISSENTPRMSG